MCHNTPQESDAGHDQIEADLQGPVGDPDPRREYRKQARALQASTPDMDAYHRDWLVAKAMAAQGYSPDAILQALVTESPYWTDDPAEHGRAKVAHLVHEVMQLPDVLIARKLVLGPDDAFGLGF